MSTTTASAPIPAATLAPYPDYLAAQLNEWQPVTINERTFLERYAANQYQVLLAQPHAAALYAAYLADPTDEKAEKAYAKFARHLRALERAARETLKELRTLIADRIANAECDVQLGQESPGDLFMPPVFPHHLLTDRKSIRQPLARTARRFALSHLSCQLPPLVETESPQTPKLEV
jgi:hypothetical protein